MKRIFIELMKGNERIVEYFDTSVGIWNEFIESHKDFFEKSIDLLGKQVIDKAGNDLQGMQVERFEKECGDKYLGQRIMAITGIILLYDKNNGFGKNEYKARNIYHLMKHGGLSLEVICYAEEVAKLYELC